MERNGSIQHFSSEQRGGEPLRLGAMHDKISLRLEESVYEVRNLVVSKPIALIEVMGCIFRASELKSPFKQAPFEP
jgi:hypothetical protein